MNAIYCRPTAEVRDAHKLLSDEPKWRNIADLTFANGAMSAELDLPLQTLASCVQFHFTETWNDTSSTFRWECPGRLEPAVGRVPLRGERLPVPEPRLQLNPYRPPRAARLPGLRDEPVRTAELDGDCR
jgi:hypothetical protein